MINDIAVRLYRRLFRGPGAGRLSSDADRVLDGNSAVALTEAALADAAALSGASSSSGAESAWQQALQRIPINSFGIQPQTLQAEGPRGAMAAAMGQTMAGLRSALFLTGPDLAATQDQLVNAAARHLPLVIHLDNQALPIQGMGRGSAHQALHLAAESGALVLHADNVQQAVDFTLIARRVAETALLPVIVAIDGEGIARSLQELRLPDRALVRDYVGAPGDRLSCPSPAQQLLFGDQRRRLPRWHDLDRPLLLGSLQAPEPCALGFAGNRPFIDDPVPELLQQALDDYQRLSGRAHHALSSHRTDDAQLLLLAQGNTLEAARTLADRLRQTDRIKAGVLGIHSLRPWPAKALLEQLRDKRQLIVLERQDNPLAGDPPLLREVRSAMAMALENRHHNTEPPHLALPALSPQQLPRLYSVIYGIAGLPLRSDDLMEFCRNLQQETAPRRYLGIDFHSSDNRHPKRQVLLDQIRRAYPGIEKLGLKTAWKAPGLRPEGRLSLVLHHRPVHGARGILADCAGLLQRLAGGRVRSRPDLAWEDWGGWLSERLIHTEPGVAVAAAHDQGLDLAIVTGNDPLPTHLLRDLRQGAGLLICDVDDPLSVDRDASLQTWVKQHSLVLFQLPSADRAGPTPGQTGPTAAEWHDAYRLGGLFGMMRELGLLQQPRRRIQSAWEQGLEGLDEIEREALTSAFGAGLEQVGRVTPGAATEVDSPWLDPVPEAVRQLGGHDETLFSLPRFWDQIGILYRNGEQDDLTADPFLTSGIVPPLSSTFRDLSPLRRTLPVFQAPHCTGCGACWAACPDSAIGVTSLTPAALLDSGIRQAGADGLRQVAGKLAAHISARGRKQTIDAYQAGPLLQQAWQWLLSKTSLPDTRREAVEAALGAVIERIGPLPLALTEALFANVEKQQKDGGELLSLVINPDACKGCGLCIAACDTEALEAQPQDPENLSSARRCWRIWEAMPDTPSATIERLSSGGDMDGLSALLMSRHCAMALAGGDAAEAGSGEKIALRMALAAVEYQQQPLLSRFSGELAALQEQVADRIRDTLADALPTDDLDSLLQNIDRQGERQIDLSDLTRGSTATADAIDARHLGSLIELAGDLKQAHWQLTQGDYGLGRARFGLAVAPGSVAGWAALFPNNPFHAPVTLDMTGDGGQMAVGLLQGQVTEMAATLDLARRARILLAGKELPALRQPHWEALDDEEKRLCPPLILVGSEQELGGRGLAQIAWLLNAGLPLKVLLLSSLDLGLGHHHPAAGRPAGGDDPRTDLTLMALAQRNAYVAQCAIAETGHYRQCLREALGFSGPALIRLHAPSPGRHGFDSDRTLQQSRLALSSRAFPLLRYHPGGEGVFGSRISLAGNPQPQDAWVTGDDGTPLTPLHWMLTERRFSSHFQTLPDDAPPALPADQWLTLGSNEKERKTPVIDLPGEAEPQLQVSRGALRQDERLGHIWRTLQELAGLVTPFTERVQQQAEQRVAAERAEEIAALKAEYDQRMQQLQVGLEDEIAGQIRDRLLSLAGYQ